MADCCCLCYAERFERNIYGKSQCRFGKRGLSKVVQAQVLAIAQPPPAPAPDPRHVLVAYGNNLLVPGAAQRIGLCRQAHSLY